MADERLLRALKNRRQISIGVIGRRSGRTITLSVWFVSTVNALWLLPALLWAIIRTDGRISGKIRPKVIGEPGIDLEKLAKVQSRTNQG